MSGQTLLDLIELVDQERQLQSGEPDVTRGLLALNAAQDYFESLIAVRPGVMGGQTGTVTTSASTETTTFPSGVLRLDRLHLLDASTSLPKRELRRLHRTGGQAFNSFWPYNLLESSTEGEPREYWTDGTNLYWAPIPDGTHTVRWYGFKAASDISAAGTFAYPDLVAMPLAQAAARFLRIGLDDDPSAVWQASQDSLVAAITALARFNRDGAQPLEYTQVHTT